MGGHLPNLDREALRKLRRLAQAMSGRQGNGMPMRELIELTTDARVGAGVTIDFEATQELSEPMIVVRVPERGTPRTPILDCLSSREREVAELVAEGLLNKQIAARLGVTTGTVKDHVHSVLEKTGLSNRAAIAAAVSVNTLE